ncbi:TIGR02099 family protein [Photobacterium sagamiensis]|uniref:YhdP family protein n=1 Tax=Photobacterium sagamiensis TaxID=2910241 RepID=UPI003D135243
MTTVPVRLVRGLMWLVLILLVLAAIAISGLRLFLPQLNEFREPIRQWASEQADMSLQVDNVEGHWRSFGPSIQLQGIGLSPTDNAEPLATINEVDLQFDLWQSALHLRPIFKDIGIRQLDIDLTQLPGFDPNIPSLAAKKPSDADISIAQRLEQFFFIRLGNFSLTDSKVTLWTPGGDKKRIDISELKWKNIQGKHLAEGVISIAGTHFNQLKVIANLSEKGDLPSLSGSIYARAQNLSLTPWLNKRLSGVTDITASDLDFEMWLDLLDGQFTNSRVSLKDSYVQWQAGEKTHEFRIQQGLIALTPHFLPQGQTVWRIDSDQLRIQTDKLLWPKFDIAAQWQPDEWQVAVSVVELERLMPFISFLPADNSLSSMLNALQPTGKLSDLRIASKQDRSPQFSAQLQQFGMQQWELLPEVHKLNANIAGDMTSGKAVLSLQDDQLPYGNVFQAPLNIDRGEVTAYWQVNEQGWRLWSDKLQVATPHLKANGEFRLDFPAQQPAWLSFYGEASINNAGETWRYLPTLALGRDLTDYLSAAIRGGQAQGAQLLWYGELADFPYSNHAGVFQANVQLEKAKFSFDTNWPLLTDLQLDLLFENDFMYLDSRHAQTMGATASRVTGAAELSAGGHLKLDIDVAAQGGDVRDYMMSTPLVDSVGAALTTVQVSGPVSSRFQLDIPFDGSEVRAWGKASLADNQLAIDTPPIQLDQVNGQLSFDNDIINAKDIKGMLLAQPVTFGFNGNSVDTGYQLDIDLGGDWQVSPLQQQFNDPLLRHVSGRSEWQATVGISLHDTGFNYDVALKAALGQINSQLPYPLRHPLSPSSTQFATVNASGNAELLSGNIIVPDGNYQAQINLQPERLVIQSSLLNIGESALRKQPLKGHGIRINSNKFDGDKWIDVVNEVRDSEREAAAKGKVSAFPELPIPTRINAQIKKLKLATLDWNDVSLAVRKKQQQWHFILGSRELTGEAFWPQGAPINIALEKMHLNIDAFQPVDQQQPQQKYVPQQDAPPATDFDRSMMAHMPDIDLQIQDAWLQGYRLGKVSGKLYRDENTLVLQNLEVNSGTTALNLDGHWTLDGVQNETQIAFDIEGENSSDLMGRFGISGGIQDASFSSYASIQWQGAPWAIHRETLTGELKTETGKGIISEVGGAGRLLGLFSIDSILRKMQLDFTGIFDDGLAFNYIKGSGKITKGIFKSDNIEMETLAGDMFIQGTANLVNETVDARVKFTPDFTSGIPVLTAFAVAPQTAVLVFAISTALSPVVDVFTQINYIVKGPIESPTVTERSRFKGEYSLSESVEEK